IDLRSDTVTKPTPAMLEVMMQTQVGDDVFGEDPSINELESKTAGMFGKEAGLFCPSGTMANQIAINVHTKPRQELICDKTSHVFLYEAGGLAFHSGLSTWLLEGNRGRLTASQIEEAIRPDNVHYPQTSIVSLENTHNRGGGSIYGVSELQSIRSTCTKHGLALHLDGARIFNACVESDYGPSEMGNIFDSISICMSKGLGAPVGSVLVGSSSFIKEARKVRKVMGGGMRQAGFLAKACTYALDHHITRLREDHRRARLLGEALSKLSFVNHLIPVDTNIVVTQMNDSMPLQTLLEKLKENNILAVPFGMQSMRMVTHLDFNDQMLGQVIDVLFKLDGKKG
ncbi:MAG: threonine aldolase family protein, partial [Bacteroidota bacterium]